MSTIAYQGDDANIKFYNEIYIKSNDYKTDSKALLLRLCVMNSIQVCFNKINKKKKEFHNY